MIETRSEAQTKEISMEIGEAIREQFAAQTKKISMEICEAIRARFASMKDGLVADFTKILNKNNEETKQLLEANKKRYDKQIAEVFEVINNFGSKRSKMIRNNWKGKKITTDKRLMMEQSIMRMHNFGGYKASNLERTAVSKSWKFKFKYLPILQVHVEIGRSCLKVGAEETKSQQLPSLQFQEEHKLFLFKTLRSRFFERGRFDTK